MRIKYRFVNSGSDSRRSITDPLTEIATQTYDAADNRTGLQNARLNTYLFTFAANNLQESLSTPLSRVFN